MPYRLSALAEQDIEEIWSYGAGAASPTTADRLIDDIIDRFDWLAEQPRMGGARPEFGRGVRSFAVENYVIYYLWFGGSRDEGLFVAIWVPSILTFAQEMQQRTAQQRPRRERDERQEQLLQLLSFRASDMRPSNGPRPDTEELALVRENLRVRAACALRAPRCQSA